LKISTADLCDHYSDRADLALQVALPGLHSFGGHDSLHGPAYTISCIDDNGLIRETVATPGERRILVVDGHASTRRAGSAGPRLATVCHIRDGDRAASALAGG
jgi:regulator of ribonuclease activity A